MNTMQRWVVGSLAVLWMGSSAFAAPSETRGWKETQLGTYVAVTREFDIDLSLCKWKLDSEPTSPILTAECTVTYAPREALDQYLRTEEALDIRTYQDRAGNKVLTLLTPLTNGFILSGSHYRTASSSAPVPVPAGSFSESQALAEELVKLYVRDVIPGGKIHVQIQALKRQP